jgi:hypothetical protein
MQLDPLKPATKNAGATAVAVVLHSLPNSL